MTATQKLKQKLIQMATGDIELTAEAVHRRYAEEEGRIADTTEELRGSGTDAGLDAPYSRNYESKAVAAQMLDGSWVGWTYFYGGGKKSK